MVCVRYKLQPMKTFAWRSWYPRVALMKLRPQVFILRKNFNISFSWNSGPWFSSCASTSLFHFHETQAPGFHPVQECHNLTFMNLSLMFSACARMSPFNFHEPQSHVFSLCLHFTAYFSWISGPCFQPLWATSTYIFSCSLTPRILSLSTVSCFKVLKFMRKKWICLPCFGREERVFFRWFKTDHSLATSCLTCCIFVAFVRVPLSTSKQEGFWMFLFSLEFVINNPQESGMKT